MTTSILITLGAVVASAAAAVLIGQARETAKVEQTVATLSESANRPASGSVDFASFSELPPAVARYFQHVLTASRRIIVNAR